MYTITKGTNVSSCTIHEDGKCTSTNMGEILFDYNFTKEEFVNQIEDFMLFRRDSEDGKKHMYFVEVK